MKVFSSHLSINELFFFLLAAKKIFLLDISSDFTLQLFIKRKLLEIKSSLPKHFSHNLQKTQRKNIYQKLSNFIKKSLPVHLLRIMLMEHRSIRRLCTKIQWLLRCWFGGTWRWFRIRTANWCHWFSLSRLHLLNKLIV